MRTRTLALAGAVALTAGAAHAAMTDNVVKVGVLGDQSGLYADVSGQGAVIAARIAAEEAGGKVKGVPIQIVSADHQNKADIGSNVTRQWIDVDKVDVVVDVPNSGVALAVSEVIRDKNRVYLNSGAATSDLTGSKCSPNTIHWSYDTYALANGTGTALTKAGGDSWYFLTSDYAFGHALERDTSNAVKKAGGKVLGGVRHPINTADFSSFLLSAQGSGAKVIGLANAGGDTINSIKQAAEFGITQGGQQLAALLLFISDVHALGLDTAQGLKFTTSYYWDLNDGTRAFADKFAKAFNGKRPTMVQAGVYSSLVHYFKALEALDSDADGKAVVAKMKEMPTDDPAFGKGTIRQDGRKLHDVYLMEVKKKSESKGPWDYYKTVATIPAAEAWRPLDQGECPLVKK